MSQSITKLRMHRPNASQTEKAIIDYILNAPLAVSNMSIHELANKTYSSPTSIIRLCKNIGFDGYKSFIKALVYEQAVRDTYFQQQANFVERTDETDDLMASVIINNVQILQELHLLLVTDVIEACVTAIEKAEKIVFFGLGASLIVAKDAQMKFVRVNRMVHLSEDWHTQLLMARNMTAHDLAFVISYSGETPEMIECTNEAKSMGATILALTKEGTSTINQLAHHSLMIPDKEVGMRSGAMSSRIAQMTVIDILFSKYLQRHYDEGMLMIERTRIEK
ncbi:MurR/RpiR family transcriptional regulator [Tuanshanicoccus lijuaniae]|uniref:MurR/RpiR family transcriptional regulator n=1 Tax=Aerococcaceae bacterium zg-1292 TaxID=2774330 RepID=UPI0019384C6D|nr:MurR/RpiR family transcriptional regulator [Aerococcaceae bacterium zg-1292]MBF6626397.1 MurR/RpiR family transcriptional regulator [Aerococcaceae bacterium zg-BR9]MBF6979151.1 MurR/RpiR family transcriptional regulator [Aerococcaceae bacterium zg-BR22]MBS4455730.1 MurR/RpiR family transcriptional regulator [Aerococcaceae bacterium zg-A91]MBS4457481.1 MurR/RpiR family transcriptional regulator [Aerococcaceae bacterium zg-BR33]